MKNHGLIQLFKSLEKEDIKAFVKYLSRLHPQKKYVLEIVKYLQQCYPNFTDKRINKEMIFKKCFGSESYHNRKLMDSANELYKYLENYLLIKKKIENPSYEREIMLAKVFHKKQLDEAVDKQFKKTQKIIDATQQQDFWYFVQQMELEHLKYYYGSKSKSISGSKNIIQASSNLDLFFIGVKLRYACEMMSRNNIKGEEHHIPFLAATLEYCQVHLSQMPISHQIYYYFFLLFTQKKATVYYQTKDLFFQNLSYFHKKEQRILLGYLINFTAISIRQQQTDFIQESFDLHTLALKKNIFLEEGFLTDMTFLNINNLACNAKNFEWAENFITEYQYHLKEEIRHICTKIAFAKFFFEKGDFSQASDMLINIQPQTPTQVIHNRYLRIAVYIENNEPKKLILDNCRTFQYYIKNNPNLSKTHKTTYLNLIYFIKISYSKKYQDHKNKLLSELEQTSPIACQTWLKSMIKRKLPRKP